METRIKNIKNDAGEAQDPLKKMRLEMSFIILGELCMYDLYGASCGQKRRTNYVFHVKNKQNKNNKGCQRAPEGARGPGTTILCSQNLKSIKMRHPTRLRAWGLRRILIDFNFWLKRTQG